MSHAIKSDEEYVIDTKIVFKFIDILRDSANIMSLVRQFATLPQNNKEEGKDDQKYKDSVPLIEKGYLKLCEINALIMSKERMEMSEWHAVDAIWDHVEKTLPESIVTEKVKDIRSQIEKLAWISSRHLVSNEIDSPPI